MFALITVLPAAVLLKAARAAELSVIELPLKIHIIRDIEVSYAGAPLTNWVTVGDMGNIVAPLVNAIWSQAGIQWRLVGVEDVLIRDAAARGAAAAALRLEINPSVLSRRELSEDDVIATLRKNRVEKFAALHAMTMRFHPTPKMFHVFVVAFLGSHVGGMAINPGDEEAPQAVVGTWTDDTGNIFMTAMRLMQGTNRAARMRLHEFDDDARELELDMETTVSVVVAHELGHLLGLTHHTCELNCLMLGTGTNGTGFSTEQISTAREIAQLYRDFWAGRIPALDGGTASQTGR